MGFFLQIYKAWGQKLGLQTINAVAKKAYWRNKIVSRQMNRWIG